MRSTTKSDKKPNMNKVIEITQSLEKCERGFVIAAELTVLPGRGAEGGGQGREEGSGDGRKGAGGREMHILINEIQAAQTAAILPIT